MMYVAGMYVLSLHLERREIIQTLVWVGNHGLLTRLPVSGAHLAVLIQGSKGRHAGGYSFR